MEPRRPWCQGAALTGPREPGWGQGHSSHRPSLRGQGAQERPVLPVKGGLRNAPEPWAAASLEAPVKANRGSCPEAHTTGQNAKCVHGSLALDAVPYGAFLPPPKPTFLFHCVAPCHLRARFTTGNGEGGVSCLQKDPE